MKASSNAGGVVVGIVVDAAIANAPMNRIIADLAADDRVWLLGGGRG